MRGYFFFGSKFDGFLSIPSTTIPSELSQLINSSLDINFTSLINYYRVSDVKNMLLDPTFNKYSILSIGLEAGFKSKSAFYDTFKKETGSTPNQYKNKVDRS